MTRRAFRVSTLIGALALLIPAVTIASSGSGITNSVIRADGTVQGPFKVNIPGVLKIQAYADMRVVDQELTILPGGTTGWHSHPGPVIVTVKSANGIFRYRESDCSFTDYTQGQTFVDSGGGHVHNGENVGSGDLDISLTFFAPPGVPLRIDEPAVAC